MIATADKDLYCLMRSDVMLVDLSTPGFGEQGVDVLFAHVAGMPIIGITDRFQHAPALLSRLDCLIAPTHVGQIVRMLELFGGRVEGQPSPRTADARTQPTPASQVPPGVTSAFAEDVLRAAGVKKVEAADAELQEPEV